MYKNENMMKIELACECRTDSKYYGEMANAMQASRENQNHTYDPWLRILLKEQAMSDHVLVWFLQPIQ